jgi:integrase
VSKELAVLLAETMARCSNGPHLSAPVSMQSLIERLAAEKCLPTNPKVSAIVESLLWVKAADRFSRRYIETLRSHLRRFAEVFETDISSIRVSEIEAWLRSLAIGARTRNNLRASIITLFHFARKQGYLSKGIPTEADEIAKAKDIGGKIGIFTPAELATALTRAAGKIQLFLALGAFTGLRSSEVLRLEWSDINFERWIITVAPEKAKTATRRLVPVQPNLQKWLEPHRKNIGALFNSRRDASRAIAFAKACQIQWPNNALRHSYATYRLALTADLPRVAIEMGTSPEKILRNYRELADEKTAEAWFSIAPIIDGLCLPGRLSEG